jgi:integrase
VAGHAGRQTAWYFTARDGSPALTIAGLWDQWRDRTTGETLKSCTMIITEANTSEIAERANLAAVHPHMLRHSCGYALADKDVPLRVIQEWLGHRSIEMTVRYTRIAQRRFVGLWRA